MRARGNRAAHDTSSWRDRAGAAPSSVAPASVSEALLALQGQAGNAATNALLCRQPMVQRKGDLPNNRGKVLSPTDAGTKLTEVRDAHEDNSTIAAWIGYIVDKVKPKAGGVRSSYVSSFDTPKGGFSVSRDLPDIPDLVVHAHYQRDGKSRTAAKVNSSQVKWRDNEAGDAPPGKTRLEKSNYDAILGSDHAEVALKGWEQNDKRHEERAKVGEFANKAWVKKGRPEAFEPGDLDALFT